MREECRSYIALHENTLQLQNSIQMRCTACNVTSQYPFKDRIVTYCTP